MSNNNSVIDLTDISDEGNSNKKKRPGEGKNNENKEPPKKKLAVVDVDVNVVDGSNANAAKAAAAAVATTTTTTNNNGNDNTNNFIYPITSTSCPLQQKGWGYGMVVYLAITEKKDSNFGKAITKCKSVTTANPKLSDCLQFDGTRHITMWQTKFRKQLTKTEAQNIRFVAASSTTSNIDNLLPIPIKFTGWKEKWTSGAYLELSEETTSTLKSIVSNNIVGLPSAKGEMKCDHLSLYRNRGIPKPEFKAACAQIRSNAPSKEWIDDDDDEDNNVSSCCGVYGTSIRFKIIGSDYSQCKVLAENNNTTTTINDNDDAALLTGGEGSGSSSSLSAEDLRRKRLEALEDNKKSS